MGAAARRRIRKHRRQMRKVLSFGAHSKRSHKRKTGRTGSIFKKYLRTLEGR